MENRWFIILNPKAGGGRAEKHWNKIVQLLRKEGLQHEVHVTHSPGHAITLARQAIHTGFRNIIAVGGDGTASEVVNGILGQNEVNPLDIQFALIPVGTGNDWGRTMGIPSDYSAAVRIIKQGKTFVQDAGSVQYQKEGQFYSRWFMNIAGMGYDAAVGRHVDEMRRQGKGGKLSYLIGLLKCLSRYECVPCQYGTEGSEHEKDIFSLAVGICKYNGGGMKQCPDALPDDGLLDMTVIHRITKWKVIRSIGKLFDGSFTREPEVAQFRGKEFRVIPQKSMMVEADGEYLGEGPASFSIRPACLKVVVK